MVTINEVYFEPKMIILEITDDKNIQRWKKFYTDKHNGLCDDFDNNRTKISNILKELILSYDDPSEQSLLSDASVVVERGYSINSWVRDDYNFSILDRLPLVKN